MTDRLDPPFQPSIPLGGDNYSRQYQDQFANVLRLFFNQLSHAFKELLGTRGGKYLNFPYLCVYDTTTQTAASTTVAYPITFNSTDVSNGISLVTAPNNSRMLVSQNGVYNVQFSIQLANNSNAPQDIDIWFRKNGVNIVNSNTRFGLAQRKDVGDPFHVVGAVNFFVPLNSGDYVELVWSTTSVDAQIQYYAAGTSPTRPAIPSVITTISFVSSTA